MKKTKIIATVGPATSTKEKIKEMILNGVDVFRINLSHSNHEYSEEIIKTIRELNKELNRNIGILIDSKGPEIRVKIDSQYININKDQYITISNKNDSILSTTYKNLHKDLKPNEILILDEGSIYLRVIEIKNEEILCKSENDGIIYNNKSLSAPSSNLNIPFLNKNDIEDIRFASKMQADFIALSFVRCADDLLDVNDILISEKDEHMQIIAKIESKCALEDIDNIIKISDGIMIARGDLAIEIELEKVPNIQKRFVKKAQEKNKICIVATEMLASMESKPRPTRAEVSDVANAVFDNVDALTLSGETAVGKYPIETIKMMNKIIIETEKNFDYDDMMRPKVETPDITTVISSNVVNAANILDAKAIIASTLSGYTAKKISSFRPECIIFTTTPNIKTATSLSLNWGIYPVVIDKLKTTDEIIERSVLEAKKALELKEKDVVIITGGFPFKNTKNTNFMKIEEIE